MKPPFLSPAYGVSAFLTDFSKLTLSTCLVEMRLMRICLRASALPSMMPGGTVRWATMPLRNGRRGGHRSQLCFCSREQICQTPIHTPFFGKTGESQSRVVRVLLASGFRDHRGLHQHWTQDCGPIHGLAYLTIMGSHQCWSDTS